LPSEAEDDTTYDILDIRRWSNKPDGIECGIT
jgi:hypothetical protein